MFIPRVVHCDRSTAEQAMVLAREHIRKVVALIKSDPRRLGQTRYNGLAHDWRSLGLFSYALGYPMEDVLHCFREATQANLEVFKLRGTEPLLPISLLTVGPLKANGNRSSTLKEHPAFPAGRLDYSLSNSRYGLQSVYLALAAGD